MLSLFLVLHVQVLNESKGLASTLQLLQELQPAVAEVIVVDGGSSDDTAQVGVTRLEMRGDVVTFEI
jgi:hypothetical protein